MAPLAYLSSEPAPGRTRSKPLCLSATHVRKSFGAFVALEDVSLELAQGEILALLGPNGAGKTTFIKILATLLAKDAGTVHILGHDLDTQADQIRHLFGYVGQDTDRSAYARLTVKENLRYFGALRGLSRAQVDGQMRKLADYLDFGANLDKLFYTLSGGQKQTVVIIRALLYDPPLVYLDEPTKGLDPLVASKIRSFLKHYARTERKSILLTSHNLNEVDEIADRVALMDAGEIPIVGSSAELKAEVGIQQFIEFPRDALPPRLKDEILSRPTVIEAATRDRDWLSFGMAAGLDDLEAIASILRDSDVHVPFRLRTTSLEDAFIHHVGALTEAFDE